MATDEDRLRHDVVRQGDVVVGAIARIFIAEEETDFLAILDDRVPRDQPVPEGAANNRVEDPEGH